MYGSEHYLSKIERNANVLDKANESIKKECLQHVIWARDLSKRLEQLDYTEREQAIKHIHEVMDGDYALMGYEVKSNESSTGKAK